MTRPMVILALIALALTSLVSAADPPELINYQGVLRNTADEPLDGAFPMTFRFFDALTVGNEILVDTHAAVTVSDGLFNVELGGGVVTDGSGPGTFTTLIGTYTGADPTQSQGGVEWSSESIPFTPTTLVVAFRFSYTAGGTFTGDLGLDDIFAN